LTETSSDRVRKIILGGLTLYAAARRARDRFRKIIFGPSLAHLAARFSTAGKIKKNFGAKTPCASNTSESAVEHFRSILFDSGFRMV
jgi:hypothetical protein